MLTKDQFFSFTVPPVKVNVPELGGDVYVRCLSGVERDAYEQSLTETTVNFRARFLVRSLCDEQGNCIFTSNDASRLGDVPAIVITKLFDVAQEVNGLTEREVKAMEKNSESDQSGNSTLD